MRQHAALTLDRWMAFNLDQQILMIANEMHRAGKLGKAADHARLMNAYERALHLTDLSIQGAGRRGLRRELLRWRDLLAALYVRRDADSAAHEEAFRCLLRFTPEASRQLTV